MAQPRRELFGLSMKTQKASNLEVKKKENDSFIRKTRNFVAENVVLLESKVTVLTSSKKFTKEMEIKGGVSKCANCSVSLQDGQYSSGVDDDASRIPTTTEGSSSSDQSSSVDKAISHQKVGSITINVNDKEIEVPLSVALAEVFKLRPLFDGKTWEEVSANQLVLCQACSLVFSKLYSLLLDFNCLRSADSFLAESIRCLEALITTITASQSSGTKSDILFQGLLSSSSSTSTNNGSKNQQTFKQDESGGAVTSANPGCASQQPMQVQLVATSNAQGQAGTTGNGPGYILINVCSTPAASVSEAEDQSSKRPQKTAGGGGGDRAVKCEKCGEECLSARALGLHRFRHHNTDNPFVCEICKKGFASIINLKLHAQRHSDSRPFECEFCGSTFKMKFDLKQHHHTVHAKDGLQLNLPNERGGKRGRMRLDQDHHTQLRQSSSSSSDIPSNQGGSLHHQQQQQQQNFSRPLPPTGISLVFKCTDCGEDFHSAMTLGVHRSSVHEAPDPYKCHLCWQSFPYSNDLRVHLTEHVNGGARNHQDDGRMFGGDGYQGNDPVQLMGFTTKSASSSSGSSQQPLNLVSIYGTSPSSSTYDPASLLEVNLEEPEMKETAAGGSKD